MDRVQFCLVWSMCARTRDGMQERIGEGTGFLPLDSQGVNIHHQPALIPVHSCQFVVQLDRRAVAGLIREPRTDGIRLARLVASSRTAAAAARVDGSVALIPYNWLCRIRENARLKPSPTIRPTPETNRPSMAIIRMIEGTVAPRAMRIPISCCL